MALIEIVSEILCFAIVKLHLLVKNDAMEKYFEKLRDLETIVRSHHVRNKKVDKIVEDLRKSTLQLEIFFFVFNVALLIGFCLCALSDVFAFLFDGILYMTFNCFFLQILIFLKICDETSKSSQPTSAQSSEVKHASKCQRFLGNSSKNKTIFSGAE